MRQDPPPPQGPARDLGSSLPQNPAQNQEDQHKDEEGEHDPDMAEAPKVTPPNNLMIKMKRKEAEKQEETEKLEEDRRKKKIAAKKKKEDDRKKEDERQAKNNHSVREMMKIWKAVEDRKNLPTAPSGNSLHNKSIVRKKREEELVEKETGRENSKADEHENLSGSKKTPRAAGNPILKLVRKRAGAENVRDEEDDKKEPDDEGRKLTGGEGGPHVQGRIRKKGVSSITDLIRNFNDLERAGSSEQSRGHGRNRNKVAGTGITVGLGMPVSREEGKMVMNRQFDRKRKAGDGDELSSPSLKRCRTPLKLRSERESARDKNLDSIFKTNTILTSFGPGPAGEGSRDDQGSLLEGVGEVFSSENSDSPEAPARINYVRPYRRPTASLLGDQNK